MQALHGAGQPDESLEALDAAAAVVQELVFGHGATAEAGGTRSRKLPFTHTCTTSVSSQSRPEPGFTS